MEICHVYIPTTTSLVRITAIDRDDGAARSWVSVNGNTDPALLTRPYRNFVEDGSRIIAGLCGDGPYILHLDNDIAPDGESWKLAVLLAHTLERDRRLGLVGTTVERVVFASGAIKLEGGVLKVARVGGIKAKLGEVQAAFDALARDARDGVIVFFPRANAREVADAIAQTAALAILEPHLRYIDTPAEAGRQLGMELPRPDTSRAHETVVVQPIPAPLAEPASGRAVRLWVAPTIAVAVGAAGRSAGHAAVRAASQR